MSDLAWAWGTAAAMLLPMIALIVFGKGHGKGR